MFFVELTPFIAFRAEQWSDEDFRGLQNFLLASPDAGDLICGYVKNAQSGLTHAQIKTLTQLMKDITHG